MPGATKENHATVAEGRQRGRLSNPKTDKLATLACREQSAVFVAHRGDTYTVCADERECQLMHGPERQRNQPETGR